jgi:hypothetical protein
LEAQKIGAQLVRNRCFGFARAFLGAFITAADFTAELSGIVGNRFPLMPSPSPKRLLQLESARESKRAGLKTPLISRNN